MTDRELLSQALEALERAKNGHKVKDCASCKEIITALRARLAEHDRQQQRRARQTAFDTLPDDYETGDY